eukprot:823516-Rhodomonas_salina.1
MTTEEGKGVWRRRRGGVECERPRVGAWRYLPTAVLATPRTQVGSVPRTAVGLGPRAVLCGA